MILILDGDDLGGWLEYLIRARMGDLPDIPEGGRGLNNERCTLIRPQTSGPCVHIDSADGDDPDAVQALGLACRHPDGACPHLDAPDVLCSVRDACYAMREVARLRETCEAEQEEQDQAMSAETEIPAGEGSP